MPQRLPFLSRRSAAGSGGRPESTAAWDAGKTGCSRRENAGGTGGWPVRRPWPQGAGRERRSLFEAVCRPRTLQPRPKAARATGGRVGPGREKRGAKAPFPTERLFLVAPPLCRGPRRPDRARRPAGSFLLHTAKRSQSRANSAVSGQILHHAWKSKINFGQKAKIYYKNGNILQFIPIYGNLKKRKHHPLWNVEKGTRTTGKTVLPGAAIK